MNKFILGSGITGLLARAILGPEWKLIPFGRSRFYSFVPPLADNHLVFHKDIDEIILELGFKPSTNLLMRAISYGGQLIFSDESFVKSLYLTKLFGDSPHPAGNLLLRNELNVYNVSATDLYSKLQTNYKNEINENITKFGALSSINPIDHTLTTDKGIFEYHKIISTIPLDSLFTYLSMPTDLPSKDVWYYEVLTPSLNFEGAKQVFVADVPFDFFKVDRLGNNQYVFHCHRDLGNPQAYLGAFLNNNLTINNFTHAEKAYPIGAPPSISALEADQIYPVGCHAQWDYFMDISSSIRRLIKLKNRE